MFEMMSQKFLLGLNNTRFFSCFGVRIQVEHAEASDCCLALTAATKAALGLKRPTTRIVGDLPKNHGISTDFGSVTPKKNLAIPAYLHHSGGCCAISQWSVQPFG